MNKALAERKINMYENFSSELFFVVPSSLKLNEHLQDCIQFKFMKPCNYLTSAASKFIVVSP
jgi:hypothetical protein